MIHSSLFTRAAPDTPQRRPWLRGVFELPPLPPGPSNPARPPQEAPLTIEDLDDDSLRIVLSKAMDKRLGEVSNCSPLEIDRPSPLPGPSSMPHLTP
jgi:hypothetical protein